MKVEIRTATSDFNVSLSPQALAEWLMQSGVDQIEVAPDRLVVHLGAGRQTDQAKAAWIEGNLGIKVGGCCG